MIEEYAWAAGFFEGEGSITIRNKRPVLQVKNCDIEPLSKFASIIGHGKLYGPYSHSSPDRYARSDFYSWTANADDSQLALGKLWSWLSARRRARALEVGFVVPSCVGADVR